MARAADDDLVLAVDDLEVALLVEDAQVAGVDPSFGIQHLRGGLRIIEIAGEDVRPPGEDLTVLGEADLHSGEGLSAVPGTATSAGAEVMTGHSDCP